MPVFYSYPLNYPSMRTSPAEAGDNSYSTTTSSASVACNIDATGDGSGAARDFTDIFVKGKGIASFTITAAGGTGGSQAANPLHDTVTNDSGETVPITIDGVQNIHIASITGNAKTVTLAFTAKSGETLEIQEVMILNQGVAIPSSYVSVDPVIDIRDSGIIQESATGRRSYAPALNNEREKHEVSLNLELRKFSNAQNYRPLMQQLLNFLKNNKQFTFGVEPNRYPDLVFPALLANGERQIRYLGRDKRHGRSVRLRVLEL